MTNPVYEALRKLNPPYQLTQSTWFEEDMAGHFYACPLTNLALSIGAITTDELTEDNPDDETVIWDALNAAFPGFDYQTFVTFVEAWDGVICDTPTIEMLHAVLDDLEKSI